MGLARIYYPGNLAQGRRLALTGNAANHAGRVLRLGESDELLLFDGRGRDHVARIEAVSRNEVQVIIGPSHAVTNESPVRISLLQGICRGQRMDMLIQKSTELGVNRIQPILAQRVVVKLNEQRARKRLDHWRSVAIGACEQSGRAVLPEITPPVSLMDAVTGLADDGARIFLDPEGAGNLQESMRAARAATLLIGPEGGLTESERGIVKAAGFQSVSLGPRTLRTETAPIAAISIIQYLAGDLGPLRAG